MHLRFLPVAVLTFLVLAGCAGNDPQARAERRPGFANVPARDRQLALAGEVREGMSPDAVFVAWGAPTHVYHGRATGGTGQAPRTLESWVYLRPMPAQPSADFGNFPADYAAAKLDFLSAYYRGDRFYNAPGTVASRFYPGAVFYPGPAAGLTPGSDRPILDRQAIFENHRLVRHVRLPAGGGAVAGAR